MASPWELWIRDHQKQKLMMKTQLTTLRRYFHSLSKALAVSSNWQRVFSHTQRRAMGYLDRVPIVLFGRSGRSWILYNIAFLRFVRIWSKNQGWKGLAIMLKVSHMCIVKYTGGDPIQNSHNLSSHRIALRSGLPLWLPKEARKLIRHRDVRVIKLFLTLTSLYRVLEYRGVIKLTTITDAGTDFGIARYLDFIKIFFRLLALNPRNKEIMMQGLDQWKPLFLPKSAPGVSHKTFTNKTKTSNLDVPNSTAALALQAGLWMSPKFKYLRAVFEQYCKITDNLSLYSQLKQIGEAFLGTKYVARVLPTYLGRLGLKDEPGKVRVFAMVDWWTQVLLRPLHKFLFSLLKNIREDGTHDQDRAVMLARSFLAEGRKAFSFDLSAATDRLPVLLQAMIVNSFLPGCGQLWAELLTARDYQVPKGAHKRGFYMPDSVRYAVGQPMGALSSWAMLAITHHFIVQFAAFLIGYRGWFPYYVVLGDDIVIFDRGVANSYLRIMEDLGVSINLSKSLVSKDSFEFAKRFIHRESDLSPLSFREMDVAGASLDALLQLLPKFQGMRIRLSSVLRFQGMGFRSLALINKRFDVMSRRMKLCLAWLTFPGNSPWACNRYVDWIRSSSLGRFSSPIDLISLRDILKDLLSSMDPTKSGSTGTLVPRDIFYGVGYDTMLTWRSDQLPDLLQTILWPVQVEYMDAHRASDALWGAIPLGSLSDESLSLETLETVLSESFSVLTEAAATPVHVDLSKYNEDRVRLVAGRWLTYWSRFRRSVGKK